MKPLTLYGHFLPIYPISLPADMTIKVSQEKKMETVSFSSVKEVSGGELIWVKVDDIRIFVAKGSDEIPELKRTNQYMLTKWRDQ
jgi:hypothetical protein